MNCGLCAEFGRGLLRIPLRPDCHEINKVLDEYAANDNQIWPNAAQPDHLCCPGRNQITKDCNEGDARLMPHG